MLGDLDSGKVHPRESQCSSRFLVQRDKVIQTEWNINHQVFNQISHCWCQPTVDWFATKLNHKLPKYVSPVPEVKLGETDALNISWKGLHGHVFCPVALILQMIQKMITYRCRIIIIAPGWQGSFLVWDSVDFSQSPSWVNLFELSFSNSLHKVLDYLNLHAWHVESVMNIRENFQR